MVFFLNKLYEIDVGEKIVYWFLYNGNVLLGRMFVGMGFWDIFWVLYLLLNFVYLEINVEMQEGLVNVYFEGGFLFEWLLFGYVDIMIGNNLVFVVVDVFLKGVRGNYEMVKFYEVLLYGVNYEGFVFVVGCEGVDYYNKLGYVLYDVGIKENVVCMLEYVYDDFVIYQMVKVLKCLVKEILLYVK